MDIFWRLLDREEILLQWAVGVGGWNISISSSLEISSTLGLYDYSFSVLFVNAFSIRLFNVRNMQHSSLGHPQHSCFTPLQVYVTHSD